MENSTYLGRISTAGAHDKGLGLVAPLQPQAGAGQDHVPEVVGEGAERIGLEHGPDVGQLSAGLLPVGIEDKLDLLGDGHVGPVDAGFIVVVVGAEQIVEDLLFLGGHVIAAGGAFGEGGGVRRRAAILGHHDPAAETCHMSIAGHDEMCRCA